MRLIDADALIEDIKTKLWDWNTVDSIMSSTVLKQTITDIGNAPTIGQVRHGRWKVHQGYCECDQCECLVTSDFKYCPNCGAKMDEEE